MSTLPYRLQVVIALNQMDSSEEATIYLMRLSGLIGAPFTLLNYSGTPCTIQVLYRYCTGTVQVLYRYYTGTTPARRTHSVRGHALQSPTPCPVQYGTLQAALRMRVHARSVCYTRGWQASIWLLYAFCMAYMCLIYGSCMAYMRLKYGFCTAYM